MLCRPQTPPPLRSPWGILGKSGSCYCSRTKSDEGERDAKTEVQSVSCPTAPRAAAISVLLILNIDTYFIFCSSSTSGKRVQSKRQPASVVKLTVSGQTAGQKVRRKPVGGFCHLYRHPDVLHPLLHLCQRAGEQNQTNTCE